MTVVITFGTFDLLHIGHIRLLKRAGKFDDIFNNVVYIERTPNVCTSDTIKHIVDEVRAADRGED